MNTHQKFAFVVDGEVAFAMRFTNEVPLHERMIAGLSSNPTIVEIPQDHPSFNDIGTEWLYVDGDFVPAS
jgi:hypothetical protein